MVHGVAGAAYGGGGVVLWKRPSRGLHSPCLFMLPHVMSNHTNRISSSSFVCMAFLQPSGNLRMVETIETVFHPTTSRSHNSDPRPRQSPCPM